MAILEIVGIGSTIAAGLVAQAPVTPESFGEIAKWPVTIALIVLAGFCVWMSFRSADKQTEVLRGLVEQLARLNERIK